MDGLLRDLKLSLRGLLRARTFTAVTAVGLYGVVALSVARRTRELGVRRALGATNGALLQQILGEGLRLAALGVAIGSLLALAATRALSGALFGVSTADPVTYLSVALVLSFVALLASCAPALRAVRVDPMVALRAE
jgi:ABC-type antimicrobial peptide transport system permease subunit